MFDSAGLAGWVETAMELAPGTLVSSKDRRDPSYAISHQLGNAGQTRVATRGRVSMRGIRARILPLRGCRSLVLGRVPEENLRAAVGSNGARGRRFAVRREADRTHPRCVSFECQQALAAGHIPEPDPAVVTFSGQGPRGKKERGKDTSLNSDSLAPKP